MVGVEVVGGYFVKPRIGRGENNIFLKNMYF
jgi:hypothetical protein